MKIVNGELDDYLESGMFDRLNRPKDFMALMSSRHWSTLEFYLSGIQMLDNWYGDKAYRQYDDWFDILDRLFMQAENHFTGRFKKEA